MTNFEGPKEDPAAKRASIGQNIANNDGFVAPLFSPTYANRVTIQTLLQTVQPALADLLTTLNSTMVNLALPITVDDTTLAAAVAQTWPNSLGTPPNYITFNYYKYLLGQHSSAATLITNAYLAAAQNVGGNSAIDLLPIVNTLNNEISYVNDFINTHLTSGLNDSSEHRSAELFQDLLTTVNTQIQNAQQIFQGQNTILTQEEEASLSSGDAQNAQALFQVNLNKLNIQLNQDQQVLITNFGSTASIFYSHFLGPALKFRQNVSSQMLPMYTGTLGAAINTSVNAANLDLQNILVDQRNRINFLANQVDQIMIDIINRDVYRNYIVQLAKLGVPIPAGLSGQMIQATDSPEALTFFQDAAAGILPPATPSFNADHQSLDDRLDIEAHPQYLLRSDYLDATPPWFKSIGGSFDLEKALQLFQTNLGVKMLDYSGNGLNFIAAAAPNMGGSVPDWSINLADVGGGGISLQANTTNPYGYIDLYSNNGISIANAGDISRSGIPFGISISDSTSHGINIDTSGAGGINVTDNGSGGISLYSPGGGLTMQSSNGIFFADNSSNYFQIIQSGTGTLQIQSNGHLIIQGNVTSIAGPYAGSYYDIDVPIVLTQYWRWLKVEGGTGALTLYTPISYGLETTVINRSGNTITVTAPSGHNIDGAASVNVVNNSSLHLVSDEWMNFIQI